MKNLGIYGYSISSMCAYELVNDFVSTIKPNHSEEEVKIRALAFEEILRKRYYNANMLEVTVLVEDFRVFKEIGSNSMLKLIDKIILDIDTLRDGFPLLGSLITGYQSMLGVFIEWQKEN